MTEPTVNYRTDAFGLEIIEVVYEGNTYKFYASDVEVCSVVYSVEETAVILAANLEHPELGADDVIEVIESNFNDSYHDMMAELHGSEDVDDED